MKSRRVSRWRMLRELYEGWEEEDIDEKRGVREYVGGGFDDSDYLYDKWE